MVIPLPTEFSEEPKEKSSGIRLINLGEQLVILKDISIAV